ncbi:hypothetical protein B0H63DRAFT_457648 [Podospora didyma]|uniref:Uncharacterized protein n=1 Tax=Podospora didyma TaxID=330526 RepID=A0AAE0U795_9PEZI|nr:hypothetical protein B0H63DRAFT_457648 [Podospora didyma]
MCVHRCVIFRCRHIAWLELVQPCATEKNFELGLCGLGCSMQRTTALFARRVQEDCKRCRRDAASTSQTPQTPERSSISPSLVKSLLMQSKEKLHKVKTASEIEEQIDRRLRRHREAQPTEVDETWLGEDETVLNDNGISSGEDLSPVGAMNYDQKKNLGLKNTVSYTKKEMDSVRSSTTEAGSKPQVMAPKQPRRRIPPDAPKVFPRLAKKTIHSHA